MAVSHRSIKEELLSLKEAAKMLKCHPNTLRLWDAKGILRPLRFGERRIRKYQKADIEMFMRKGHPAASAKSDAKPVVASLPTQAGDFQMTVWPGERGQESCVLSTLTLRTDIPVMVRIHSECLTGDVFHSLRCDCGAQKDLALAQIQRSGNGLMIYLRQEGRGIGLYEKTRTYQLQEKGYDTFEANTLLGHAPDEREYSQVKKILAHFEVSRVLLLTNNPSKIAALASLGIEVVERIPLIAQPKGQNRAYLETKQKKFKHFFGEESNYFFQCSDVETVSQIEELGAWMRGRIRDPYLRICIGISADERTLLDPLACEAIVRMFTATKLFPYFVPILHFSFRGSLSPLKTIEMICEKLPFVEYIQLNDIKEHHTTVLQKAVQHFLVDFPLKDQTIHLLNDALFIDLIKKYKAFICLDSSEGRGKTESFASYARKINLLLKKGINDIAVYGGFGPKRLATYKKLRKFYKINLSIDAESYLKTNGHFDIQKAKAYLSELMAFSV